MGRGPRLHRNQPGVESTRLAAARGPEGCRLSIEDLYRAPYMAERGQVLRRVNPRPAESAAEPLRVP